MRLFLIVLTLIFFAADLAVFVRFRTWLARMERTLDGPMSPSEERHLQRQIKLIGVLSAAWTLLTLILIFL